ncbi:hypothetical protein PQU96_02070 [Vogesella sp. LYT5W]|uniref:Uncharacterized protein n=1 Tax=Vogesella margarita TaxID=2984199 RepID=A0ABT5IK61_9NEIS|nr:hypothetical protein [Vogesella margarita]MDC7712920.1 hypothetical protein [Vogesella margarita]
MSKPKIGARQFAQLSMLTGQQKAQKAVDLLNMAEYSPAKDHYKKAREAIKEIHKNSFASNLPLENAAKSVHPKKINTHVAVLGGWNKWIKKQKDIKSAPTISDTLPLETFDLHANPEIAITDGEGKTRQIKLYLQQAQLKKETASMCIHLMKKILGEEKEITVLDVMRGKEFFFTGNKRFYEIALNAEIRYLESISKA